jgi:flagellar basal body-associated protein FliL
MIKTILIAILIILFVLAVFTTYLFISGKEKKYPKFFSFNWPVLFIAYAYICFLGVLAHVLF